VQSGRANSADAIRQQDGRKRRSIAPGEAAARLNELRAVLGKQIGDQRLRRAVTRARRLGDFVAAR